MSDRVDLVFGLVGPIGCLIHEACDSLEYTLKSMDYTPVIINLSAEMDSLLKAKGCDFKDEFESTFEEKILKGNLVRKKFANDAVLAAEAMRQILVFRLNFAPRIQLASAT